METKNYDLFTLIKGNRVIQKGLVERLKKSITKIGYIKARPILVNKKMEILDGQNRFVACKELKLPIIYSIHDNCASDDTIIAELNKNQLVWRLSDYIHHFSEKNIPCYVEVKKFEEKYHFGISNAITICLVKADGRSGEVRTGKNFPINKNKEKIADFLIECNDLFFSNNTHFCRAVACLFNNATEKQIAKVKRKHLSIPQQPAMSSYLTVFQNLINRNAPEQEKIYFTK